MPSSTPLLLPIRVTACALDPDAMPAASNARATPHKWSWSAPDYAGFKPDSPSPLDALWPPLFNAPRPGAPSDNVGAPPPLARGLQGSPGVCVSWSVPPGWSRPLVKDDTRSLPHLPDRWLVVRFARKTREVNSAVRVKAWVVDAGVFVNEASASATVLVEEGGRLVPRRVGAVRTVDAARTADASEARVRLHVQGSEASADFTFAAFAPANLNNLSFIDPLDDLLNAAKDGASDLYQSALTYAVIGWYRSPEQDDPLAKFKGRETEAYALRALGVDPVQALVEKDRHKTEAEARQELKLGATERVIPQDRSVFHGAVACVDYFDPGSYWGPQFGSPNAKHANGATAEVDPTQPPVGFGDTAEEALARLMSGLDAETDAKKQLATQAARLLMALLTDQHWTWDALGSSEIEPRAVKGAKFQSARGGTEWVFAPPEKPADTAVLQAPAGAPQAPSLDGVTPEHRRALYDLNEAQRSLDRLAWDVASAAETLYAVWRELQTRPSNAALAELVAAQKAAVESLKSDEATRRTQVEERQKGLAAALEAATNKKLSVRSVEAPRFFTPKEPAVALRGIGARLPARPLPAKGRTLAQVATRRAGGSTPDDAEWFKLVAVVFDADLREALAALVREAALVEAAVADVTRHHAESSSTKDVDLWRRRALGVHRDLGEAALLVRTGKDTKLPRAEPMRVTLETSDGVAVDPSDLCTVWTQQPWVPLFLDWEVAWYGADSPTDARHSVYQGRTVLAHRPQNVVRSRYEAILKQKEIGARLQTALRDCKHVLDEVFGADVVAQSLSGVYQQRMGRDDALPRVAPHADKGLAALVEGTSLAPVRKGAADFSTAQRGSIEVRRLWVVDRFGQAYALTAPTLTVPASAVPREAPSRVNLPRRVLEATRLALRPRIPVGSSSVVRGWIVPNLLDESLVVYDERSAPLGVIRAQGDRVVWRPARAGSPRDALDLRDESLRRFVERLVQTPDDTSSVKRDRFERLKGVIDDALVRTHPSGSSQRFSTASLLGRPLALVRAELKVERRGGRTLDPRWLGDDTVTRALAAAFTKTAHENLTRELAVGAVAAERVSITVGSRYVPDDGLIGYYVDHADDLRQTLKTDPQGAPKIELTAPLLDPSAPCFLDLLLDPRGRVQLDPDVLPAVSFSLAPEWYEDDLQRLPAVLRVAPVLLAGPSMLDALTAPGEGPRLDLPLPAGSARADTRDASKGVGAPRFSVNGAELGVESTAPVPVVAEGEVAAADGLLILHTTSTGRSTERAREMTQTTIGQKYTADARTEWLEYKGNRELFLVVSLASESASPASVQLGIPREWKPGETFIGNDARSPALTDTLSKTWQARSSSVTRWDLTLDRLEHVAADAKSSSNAAAAPTTSALVTEKNTWILRVCVLLQAGAPGGELGLKLKLDEHDPKELFVPIKPMAPVAPPPPPAMPVDASTTTTVTTTTVTTTAPTPAPSAAPTGYTVELKTDSEDTSALKYGASFKLSWEVQGVESADLWGPLSDDGKNHRTIFPTPKDEPNLSKGSKTIVVTGPMNFTLRARVKVGDREESVVRALSVGVMTDPRGGRVDVWPRQVLPRGPIAVHWSAYKVTSFKFHAITGDVVDDEVDGPAILNDEFGYDPSDKNWATTVRDASFTLDYGPRAGQDWTVEAECEPEGDARALQCRVGAIGTRRLSSSVKGQDGNESWSYLAVGASGKAASDAASLPTGSGVKTTGRALAMAVGRFAVKADDDPERWREWIAVATTAELEVHINKMINQRAYRLDPALHPDVPWLRGVLEGPVLGVGAAEYIENGIFRGENVVVVRRGGPEELLVKEFRFPLDGKASPREIMIRHTGYATVDRVQVVGLWPRVYVFGRGVVFSYDRSDPTASNWFAVREPKLVQVASPEWEIVGVPRPRAEGAAGLSRDGYIFAMTKKDGRLFRFEMTNGAEITRDAQEMASANGGVASLHDLQKAQRNSNQAVPLTDGRIMLGRDPENKLVRVNPINEESSLLVIGGALVARSEVHDPLVQVVYSKADAGKGRRGLQDRAYNPRLDLWVRCGHPFYHARAKDGALFDSTVRSLYCRTADGEIAYIYPIEPSHLGFLATDLTPKVGEFKSRGEGPVFDTLVAGQELTPGKYLESKNKQYRLTYTTDGNLVLHRTDAPQTALWKLETLGAGVGRALLKFGGDLVLMDARDKQIRAVSEHESTTRTPLRELSEEERVRNFRDVRLTLTDAGGLLCLGKTGSSGQDELLWSAVMLGDTLREGKALLPTEHLESKNGAYRFVYVNGTPQVIRVADQKAVYAPEVSAAVRRVEVQSGRFLVFLDDRGERLWTSEDWGGASRDGYGRALRLGDDGTLSIRTEPDGRSLWSTPRSIGDRLQANAGMAPGQYLQSPGKEYQLLFGYDGNLVLINREGRRVWYSRTIALDSGRAGVHEHGILFVKESAGGVVYEMSGFRGGRHYRDGVLCMTSTGFRCISPDGTVVWWAVEEAGGFPSNGSVKQTNATEYKIYDYDAKGYVFGVEEMWHDEARQQRHIGLEVNGGQNFDSAIWIIERIRSGRCTIRNKKLDLYLRVAGMYGYDARFVVTVPESRMHDETDVAIFDVSVGDEGTIRSVAYDLYYVYATTYDPWYGGRRRRVCCWARSDKNVLYKWKFEPL